MVLSLILPLRTCSHLMIDALVFLACTDNVQDISLAMGIVSVFCVLRRGRDKQLEANDPHVPLTVHS